MWRILDFLLYIGSRRFGEGYFKYCVRKGSKHLLFLNVIQEKVSLFFTFSQLLSFNCILDQAEK